MPRSNDQSWLNRLRNRFRRLLPASSNSQDARLVSREIQDGNQSCAGIFEHTHNATIQNSVFTINQYASGALVLDSLPLPVTDSVLTEQITSGCITPSRDHVLAPPLSAQIPSQDVYVDLLLRKRRGYPLYTPSPNGSLPILNQTLGVSIGDVGILTPEGGFDYLFNILHDAAHPINAVVGVPDEFLPFRPGPAACDVQSFIQGGAGSFLADSSIVRVDHGEDPLTTVLEAIDSAGAALMIPEDMHSTKLKTTNRLRKYVEQNLAMWYRYVKHTLGHDIENGDLRVVYGCWKSSAFGIATAFNNGKRENTRLSFSVGGSSVDRCPYRWTHTGSAETKTGSSKQHNPGLSSTEPVNNQCLFVNTIDAKLSADIWKSVELNTVVHGMLSPTSGQPNQDRHKPLAPGESSTSGSEATNFASSLPCSERVFHPSAILHDTLEAIIPGRPVYIVCDDDWTSFISDSILTAHDFIAKVLENRIIVEDQGMVFFCGKDEEVLLEELGQRNGAQIRLNQIASLNQSSNTKCSYWQAERRVSSGQIQKADTPVQDRLYISLPCTKKQPQNQKTMTSLGLLPHLADVVPQRNFRSPPPSVRTRKEPRDDQRRVPYSSHRHAAPSGPWPWMDLEDEIDEDQLTCPLPPIPPSCSHDKTECKNCWKGYPQSRSPNWTQQQFIKSKVYHAIHDYNKGSPCVLYRADVSEHGFFTNPGAIVAKHGEETKTWRRLVSEKVPDDVRVRVMFIENMSGPILQMLGAKFNLEPFFWSSSLNWIPSCFQEEIQPGVGDHITITLTFLRSMSNFDAVQLNAAIGKSADNLHSAPTLLGSQMIDPHAPLMLHSNDRLLVLDLLAVHLIRNVNGSTLISFHPTLNIPTTTAAFLHKRIRFAGQSIYWQNIFRKTPDPTFVLLTFIWHAMYAWDEALENLYSHICSLETRVINTSDTALTRELHTIHAHQLHYASLLGDFEKHVKFVRDTHNPLMERYPEELQRYNKTIMERECSNLLTECKRLSSDLVMQEQRLKNFMGLVLGRVNMQDSRYMKEMTEAAVRDSAGMKQIAYLTMVFLPASFVAGVFGMNVSEINPGSLVSIPNYVSIALPLVVITVWITIASQSTYIFPPNTSPFLRLGWPLYLIYNMMTQRNQKDAKRGFLATKSALGLTSAILPGGAGLGPI